MSNSAPNTPYIFGAYYYHDADDIFVDDVVKIYWTFHYEGYDYKEDADDNFKEVVVEYCFYNYDNTHVWVPFFTGVGEKYDFGGYDRPGYCTELVMPSADQVPDAFVQEQTDGSLFYYICLRVKAYDTLGAESNFNVSATSKVWLSKKSAHSAPTTPSSITVPSSIKGGDTVSISWGASTDEDDNLSGYVLERSVNSGTTWTEIYNGSGLSTTNLVASGLTSVMYRVKAYDSEGLESEYQSSSLISVRNNTAPKISGSDGSLGTKTFAFTQSYTVTDDEGGTVTVVEKVDGVTYKSYAVTLGNSNLFSFTDSQWKALANGSHTVTLTATDTDGATVTRTYTFTKSETEIELTYTTAISASAMPTVGVYYISKEIPSGASFSVKVCNNGFDASPTWEDVTSAVNNGGRFYFNNTSKTASKWGVNAEIKVSRNGASGDCYISSVRGYFK